MCAVGQLSAAMNASLENLSICLPRKDKEVLVAVVPIDPDKDAQLLPDLLFNRFGIAVLLLDKCGKLCLRQEDFLGGQLMVDLDLAN